MKAILKVLRAAVLTVATLLFLPLDSEATHAMGTDITYRWLTGDTYEFTLTFYRDCAGTTAPGSINLGVNSLSGCGQTGSVTLLMNGGATEVSPICPSQSSNCAGGSFPGVEQYIYTGIYTFVSKCPDWSISWNHCCRNSAVTNLNAPSARDMYVETLLNNADSLDNSSPTFTSLPVPYLCAGQTFCYNHGAFDPDGDSLAYRLIAAQDGPFPSTNIPYNSPYSPTYPITTASGSVAFDPVTGNMCLTPNASQFSVVTIAVDEYRDGVLIGTTLRDLQIVVQTCTNNLPAMSSPGIINQVGGVRVDDNSVEVCVGETTTFEIEFSDPDLLDVLTVTSNMTTTLPGATITTTGTNPITAQISWTPPAGSQGFHDFTLTVQDNGCPFLGTQVYYFDVVVPDRTEAGPDQNYCPGGGPVNLTATGGSTFSWSVLSGDAGSLTCNPCATQTVSPAVTTTYEVVSNLGVACINRDTVVVTRIADFPLTLTPASPSICRNQIVNLSANAGPGGGPFTYNWFPGTYLDSTAIATPNANPDFTTKYFCEVTSGSGCTIRDSVTVTVTGQGPTVTILPTDTAVCQGAPVLLEGEASMSPANCGLNPSGCTGTSTTGTIGTGTNSTGYAGPFYGSITQVYNMRHQYIYDAAELQAQGFTQGGTLTEIALNLRYARTLDFDNFTIKIGCTSLTEFPDNNYVNGLSTVYFATVHTLPVTAGWHTIILDTPYDWDGASNLIVEFCSNGTQDNNQNYVYYSATAPLNKAMYDYGSSAGGCSEPTGTRNALRPNMQFTVCTPTVTSPTYSWTPTTGLSDPAISNPIATPSGTTTYQLNITDGASGCTGSGQATITVGPNFVLTSTPDTTICFGAGVSLTAVPDRTDTYTHLWEPPLSLDNPSSASPYANPIMDTQYKVAVSNAACTKFDTVLVAVAGTPIEVVTNIDTVCPGSTVQLDIETVSSLNDDFEPLEDVVMWSTINGGSVNADCGVNSGSGALHFDGTTATREATSIELDASSCSTLDFCLVFGSGPNGDPCNAPEAGEDVALNYSTDGGSTWTQIALYDEALYTTWTCFSVALPPAAQTANTMFQWKQVAFSPCDNCDNWALDDVSLSCSATGGPYLYSWTPTFGLSDSTVKNPTAVVDPGHQTYSVRVTDQSNPGCVSQSTLTVRIDSSIYVAVSAADPTPCAGDGVQLNANVFGFPLPTSLPSCGVNGTVLTEIPITTQVGNDVLASFFFSPFYGSYKDAKFQYLVTASELQAAGIMSGTITELALNITLKTSFNAYRNFSIEMNCTNATSLSTAGWEPTVPVYGPASITTTSGWNTIPITGFDWDGTSNIVITMCYDNPNTQSPGGYDYVEVTATPYTALIRNFSNTNDVIGCNLNPTSTWQYRPNFRFTVVPPSPNPFVYSWTPASGLSDPNILNPVATFSNDIKYAVTVSGGKCVVSDTVSLTTCSPLPVDAMELSGEQQQTWVDLNWWTLNEVSTDFFVVQRSHDGEHFEDLGQVNAAKDFSGYQSYPYRDESPYPGINFYRVKLVDLDGGSRRSNTISVNFEGNGGMMQVYPNPARPQSQLNITYWSENSEQVIFNIYDLRGVLVQSFPAAVQPGLNQLNLFTGDLTNGVYLLNSVQGTLTQTRKLMILE